ncbi:MAG: 5-oxoprolinase subunit PxpB [Chloroflexota bacterium]|nr:5-oxoprolinase subunit PxpB [Chloroflexota bacterium]
MSDRAIGRVRAEPFGDAAVLVTFGETIDRDVNRRVHTVARQLDAMPEGDKDFAFSRSVPAYSSLLIPFDRWEVSAHEAAQYLQGLIDGFDLDLQDPGPPTRLVEIPVRYGGDQGHDLLDVAGRTGLTPAQVLDAHASVDYDCFFLGFAPGFGYLGLLPKELELPRRGEPRTRVPAGSVAIAGRQTAVYPSATPGGWHLIGRTKAVLWDVSRDPPALLAPGDKVRFVPESD